MYEHRLRGRVYRLQRCTSHIPGAVFEAQMLDNQEGTSSASTGQDVFEGSRRENADLFSAATVPTAEISSMENRPRGGAIHIAVPVYGSTLRSRGTRVSTRVWSNNQVCCPGTPEPPEYM